MFKMNEVASFLPPDSLRERWGGDAGVISTTEARECINSNGGIKEFLLQSEKFYRRINFFNQQKNCRENIYSFCEFLREYGSRISRISNYFNTFDVCDHFGGLVIENISFDDLRADSEFFEKVTCI